MVSSVCRAEEQGDTTTNIPIVIDGKLTNTYVAEDDYWFFVEDICDALQIKCDVLVRNAKIDNAIYTKMDGNNVIIYDRRLSDIVGLEGAVAILAHELGHYYCQEKIHQASSHEQELQADAIAGAALRKMRFDRKLQGPYQVLLSKKSSKSHPASSNRNAAYVAGYDNPTQALKCDAVGTSSKAHINAIRNK